MAKIKVGDTYLFRGRVTTVSDDQRTVTFRIPGYEYPVTISADALERHADQDIVNEQTLGRRR